MQLIISNLNDFKLDVLVSILGFIFMLQEQLPFRKQFLEKVKKLVHDNIGKKIDITVVSEEVSGRIFKNLK